MAALYDQSVYDAALNVIRSSTTLRVCSGTPTDRASAVTNTLATVSVSTSDFTLGAGSPSGRQVVVAAKSGVAVTVSGTAGHYCLDNGTTLLARVGVNPASPALTASSTVDIPATTWTFTSPTES